MSDASPVPLVLTSSSNPLYGKQPSAAKLEKQRLHAEKKLMKLGRPCQNLSSSSTSSSNDALSTSSNTNILRISAGDRVTDASDVKMANDYRPKVPHGTRDATPEQVAIRDKAFDIIKDVFARHGAVGIDTPVFELRDTLSGKYGEDSKLIFDLAEQGGGERCSLRYDLTVPFARYLATHAIDKLKRYHIARVYRRDTPAVTKGRFREFYQCDFDIAGVYPSMVPDSEALKVMTEILDALPGIGAYKIKLNHRLLLDGVMAVCGVPPEKLRPICSAIDKLDKMSWDSVKSEMVNLKGLDSSVADQLGRFVRIAGQPQTILRTLKQNALLMSNVDAAKALEELDVLFTFCDAIGCLDRIEFDLGLARGLDYYTGVIYEAVQVRNEHSFGSPEIGSIAAGGRYDNLVGIFSGKQVPIVGISIGIERILNILEEAELFSHGKIKCNATQVLIASIGPNLLTKRLELAAQFWKLGIATEYLCDMNPKPRKQLDYALANQIRYVVWVAEDELKDGNVKVKDLYANMDSNEHVLPFAQSAKYVETLLQNLKMGVMITDPHMFPQRATVEDNNVDIQLAMEELNFSVPSSPPPVTSTTTAGAPLVL